MLSNQQELKELCDDIRGGRLTCEEAVDLVKKYDGEYIGEDITVFFDYYKMTKEEFDELLDCHANKDLFEKKNGIWTPKFIIE